MARTIVTERSGGFGIDTSAFRLLAKQLRRSDTLAYKNLRTGMKGAGEIVATKARATAAEHSTTIPPTIKVGMRGTSVYVQAGNPSVPIAALFELGNTGGRKSMAASARGTFRHPVFADPDTWVEQPMHPYLRSAELSSLVKIRAIAKDSLTAALEESGIVVD